MMFLNPNGRSRAVASTAAGAVLLALLLVESVMAQGRVGGGAGPGGAGGRFGGPAANEPATRGVLVNTAEATAGYTLFAPLNGTSTYLIDLDGGVVRQWESELVPSAWVYLLDNGDLLRGGREPETSGFSGGGQGGRIQRFTFDGELIWDYTLNSREQLPHHDVAVLPNGNLLAIVWEYRGAEATRAAGRREGFIPDDGIWNDAVIELEPDDDGSARVVWEWRVWDHLVQNADSARANYGDPADYPGRIDINADIIGRDAPQGPPTQDVFHINSVAYNSNLDQIILSSPTFNEVWVIDHSTTTAEAAGQGGELLYRWGNPQNYGRGTADDTRLGFQHDAKWIDDGLPGAGNLMIFSNRTPPALGFGGRTVVYELAAQNDRRGRYTLPDGAAYGPTEAVWTYAADDFSATYISGAVRLWSGNTLISSGPQGRLFEVDPAGTVVWDYWQPYGPNTESEGAAAQNPFAVFRAIRIPPDHPGLAGRNLEAL